MKKVVMFIGLTTFLFLTAQVAAACSCLTGSPKENLAEVQAVFLGKIIAAKKHEWTIAVDKVWKGEVEEEVLMRDLGAGTSCEFQFNLEESYIFFAYIKKSKRKVIFNPAVCTWTVSLKYRYDGVLGADYVLKELGEGQPPIKKTSKEESQPQERKISFCRRRSITTHSTGAAIARLSSARLACSSRLAPPG